MSKPIVMKRYNDLKLLSLIPYVFTISFVFFFALFISLLIDKIILGLWAYSEHEKLWKYYVMRCVISNWCVHSFMSKSIVAEYVRKTLFSFILFQSLWEMDGIDHYINNNNDADRSISILNATFDAIEINGVFD